MFTRGKFVASALGVFSWVARDTYVTEIYRSTRLWKSAKFLHGGFAKYWKFHKRHLDMFSLELI